MNRQALHGRLAKKAHALVAHAIVRIRQCEKAGKRVRQGMFDAANIVVTTNSTAQLECMQVQNPCP